MKSKRKKKNPTKPNYYKALLEEFSSFRAKKCEAVAITGCKCLHEAGNS